MFKPPKFIAAEVMGTGLPRRCSSYKMQRQPIFYRQHVVQGEHRLQERWYSTNKVGQEKEENNRAVHIQQKCIQAI
jgi:hypothetical protein